VSPRDFSTRQVFQNDGLAFSLSLITKARGVRVVMPQFFYPFNMEERTLLARGEEITTPQVVRASNSHVPRVHVH